MQNNIEDISIFKELLLEFDEIKKNNIYNYLLNLERNIKKIKNKNDEMINYIENLGNVLDDSIYGHKNAKFDVNEFENLVYGAKGSTSGRVNRLNYISINSTLACEPINPPPPPPHGSLLRNVLDKVTSTKGAHSIMAA